MEEIEGKCKSRRKPSKKKYNEYTQRDEKYPQKNRSS